MKIQLLVNVIDILSIINYIFASTVNINLNLEFFDSQIFLENQHNSKGQITKLLSS